MTNVGLIEATTSAIGEELTKLFGFASTRLTAQANPETQVQSGINSMTYDGNVTVTLTAGTYLPGVANPMRLRVLSGAAQGLEAIISLRNNGTTVTLAAPLPGAAAFAGASFQIVNDADATLTVENTLEFAPANSPGRLVMDGVVYFYAGLTPTSFTGLTRDDGTGLIVKGVAQVHAVLAIVSDYSRALSALDAYRRSFLLGYAVGSDLNVVGANLGVNRPPELIDDTVFRNLISAVAYSPRGTIFSMEQVLDVLLGETVIASGSFNASGSGDPFHVTLVSGAFPVDPISGLRFRVTTGYQAGRTIRIKTRNSGTDITLNEPMASNFSLQSWAITQPNWEIFEDLVLGSLHHACTVFFRRTDNQNLLAWGKTFLDGEDARPLSSTTTLDYTGFGRKRTCSVRLKDEGGIQQVGASNSTHLASSTNGTNITGPAGSFPATIKVGDYFQLMSGTQRGLIGVVQARVSDAALTLGLVAGAGNPSPTSTGVLGVAFTNLAWQALRDKTNCRFYRPSAESRKEHPADAGTQTWFFQGANENADVTVVTDATFGAALKVQPANDVNVYQRHLRITPEANADVEILLDVGTACTSGAADGKQVCLALGDGERVLAWGVIDNVGNADTKFGFLNVTTGNLIGTPGLWSDVAGSKFTPGLGAVRLVKRGRDVVQLYRQAWQGAFVTTNWELVDTLAYSAFPTVAAWSAAAPYTTDVHEIAWGTLQAGHTPTYFVKYVDWKVRNVVDFWNRPSTGSTSNPAGLADGSNPFLVTDVGKLVRVRDFSALNASKGNSLGVWEIGSWTDAGNVTLTGPTKYRGGFSLDNRGFLEVRGDKEAFVWPDHRGHAVQIIDGVNAHTCPILAIIDPVTRRDFEEPTFVPNDTGASAIRVLSTDPTDNAFPPFLSPVVRIAGTVGGVPTTEDVSIVGGGTSSLTNWDAGSVKSVELVQQRLSFVYGPPTMKGLLKLINKSNTSTILSIAPGETHFGKPGTVADSANWTSVAGQRIKHTSNIVLLDTSGLPGGVFALTDTECKWKLIPNFPVDASITYDLIDAGTDAAGALTFRSALPFGAGTVMMVHASKVLSAYLFHEGDPNLLLSGTGPSAVYQLYPFYLYDGFGYVRTIMEIVRAAGIKADFDHLVSDASGRHVLED